MLSILSRWLIRFCLYLSLTYSRIKIGNGVVYEQEESLRIRSIIKMVRGMTVGECMLLTGTCSEGNVGIDKSI